MIRVEVTDRYGTVAEFIELPELRRRDYERLAELASNAVSQLAGLLGSSADHARNVLISDLIRLVADANAYEREAERRGVLPL